MSIELWFPIGIMYSQSLTVVSHWVSGFEPDAYHSLSNVFSFLEEAFFLLLSQHLHTSAYPFEGSRDLSKNHAHVLTRFLLCIDIWMSLMFPRCRAKGHAKQQPGLVHNLEHVQLQM